jgi:hypothetical protein
MYYDTSLKMSRVDWSALPDGCHEMGKIFFPSPKRTLGFWEKREMDGPRKDMEDTTLVQSEEDMIRTIRALPFVTKLSPLGAQNSHGHGYRVSLRCPSCEEYCSCGKK